MVGGFAADAPLLKQINRKALDIRTVQRINGYYGDLGVGLLIDLKAEAVDPGGRARVEDVREIVDVACRLKL